MDDAWTGAEWFGLRWSPWCRLLEPTLPGVPAAPGLYRVRAVDGDRMMYLGQTGSGLRKRLQQLRAGLL